jgi:hypothetical protein
MRFLAYRCWPAAKHRKWVHPALFVQQSTVPGAGRGVFAARDIPKGSHLGYYCGRVYWSYPRRNKRDWAYLLTVIRRPPWIPRDKWRERRKADEPPTVDGTGLLSLCNCCHGGRTQNAEFSYSGRFYSVQDIRQGDEVLIAYGDGYWEDR